jgi:phosphatidylinositol alpha-1,6-mannosyltransferase
VDVETFRPGVDGGEVRSRYCLQDAQVIVCVSRLVARKGQDSLIRALPAIRARAPRAALLIVGSGPYGNALRALATRNNVADHVVFTGNVSDEDLPAHFAAGDIFAMPCRTRRGGADVEGLGIVYLEASAVGIPVVAGNSGGAPDAVREGETGFVIDGRDPVAVADTIGGLLADAGQRAALGAAGRRWVERDWQWDTMAARLRGLLDA